jgi:hypothetical protein
MKGGIRSVLCLIWMFAMTAALSAQAPVVLDFGVRGGVIAGQILQVNPYSGANFNYLPPNFTFNNAYGTVGPAISALLYDRVEVRFEAVYKRFGYQVQSLAGSCFGSCFVSTVHDHTWEYPLLATYRFGSGSTRPFLGGGLNLRANMTSADTSVYTTTTSPGNVTIIPISQTRTTPLTTAYYIAGGLEYRSSLLTIRPEVRYTRWPPDLGSSADVRNTPNQFEVLIGVSLHPFRIK